MQTNDSKYYLSIYYGSITTESDAGAVFSLSARLRKAGRHLRPGQPLREEGEPVVALFAKELLATFFRLAQAEGYLLRVDVAKARSAIEPWPRWCGTSAQLLGLLSVLDSPFDEQDRPSAYPASMWFIPAASPKAENLVRLFRELPADGAIFGELLRANAFRIALFDAFFDLLAAPALAESVFGWMQAAANAHREIPLEWNREDA